MAGLKDSTTMTVDGAFLAKNTAETTVKTAKFTVKYVQAHLDLYRAEAAFSKNFDSGASPDHWTLANPPSKAERLKQGSQYEKQMKLRKQRHREVYKARLRIKRYHRDIRLGIKNRVLAPYYNLKNTIETTYRIAKISKDLLKRGGRGTYHVS